MTNPEEQPPPTTETSAALPDPNLISSIELPVGFDLGTLNVPIGQLKSIQAGFVFELLGEVSQPVSVKVNGVEIARGELVRVENRLGVRIVEIHNHADSSS